MRTWRPSSDFRDVWFLPGFWAEFGMCTEPSAFGGKCVWHENAFPERRSLFALATSLADEAWRHRPR